MEPGRLRHPRPEISAQGRRAGAARAVEEAGVPAWLWRRVPDAAALAALPKEERSGAETSAKQCFDRLAGTWTYWGWKGGYFDAEDDARAFYDELRVMLARQMGAPNSPQWFNTGLYWAYGIDGPAQGHYYVDYRTGKVRASESAYEHPQPHACFIQSVADDLVNEGGIMDLWVREARLFKYGSGTGSNFSKLRGDGERLSGGGRSSGLMSFLKIGDRAAGAIKSGGTTRRAAKMVIVDADHPDIEDFIDWKVIEEQKVAALVAGSKLAARHLNLIMAACREEPEGGGDPFDPAQNPALKREIRAARRAMIPENYVQRVIQFARQGYATIDFRTYDTDWDSEAYLTVAGQNSNNTVRITNDFLDARRVRRRLAADPAHRRQGVEDRAGRARCGTASRMPPGPRPIPASSSTPRSTTGTPVRKAAGSTPRTRARNTCSSTTRRAIWPRSTCWPFAARTAALRSPSSSMRCGCGRWSWKSR